jgi:beta-galactosidase/beta-glucuronidase
MMYKNQAHSVKKIIPLAFLILISIFTSCESPTPYAPANGITISNNMPNLSWKAVNCDYYQIIIDDKIMVEVPADRNYYTPVNLSFGKHSWKVLAISGDNKTESQTASFIINDEPLEQLPESTQLIRNNWKVKSALLTKQTGQQLTTSDVNKTNWHSTSVPATALTVLVRNGVYPNPYVSLNNMQIPDASDEFNAENDLLKFSHIENQNPWKNKYWYFTEFSVPADKLSKISWINLGEINYRAEVWLNGKLVADSSELVGMERKFKLPTTGILKSHNKLAIAIYPPDHIGKPAPPPIKPLAHPGRNLGEDAMITNDYTKWDVLGWDWQPGVRDRDMGITEDVYLTFTDEIELTDLYVTSDLNLPDTTQAEITISANIVNHTSKVQNSTVTAKIEIDNKIIELSKNFKISPNNTEKILFDGKKYKELVLNNPKLWWPFGYGAQNLYNVELSAQTKTNQTAKTQTHFGIREVETYIGNNERVYKINGEKIYMKGGNWVIDMMLNWTASRYEHEIKLTKASGLNLLRVWGPTGAPPKAFYDAADKHGVLIWQDFLNDYWGTFKNNPDYKPSAGIFRTNTIAMVKKYRNHPSLVIWCGGNEGPNPREEMIMNEILPAYDGRDSKHYLKISNADGLHGGGPYHTLAPQKYFTSKKLHGFSSELGPSGVPELESMKKFMMETGQNWKPGQFPLNSEWTYHDANDRYGSDERKFTHYHNLLVDLYGSPDSTGTEGFSNYVKKSQLINYDAYRSCIEAINAQLWENSSGYALWKSNSSWPSVVWQVYDWYLQAHAGFYATKNANEQVHIQLNRETMEIDVLNAKRFAQNNMTISAIQYDNNLQVKWEKQNKVKIEKNSVKHTGWIVPGNDKITYLLLKVENADGKIISKNFYWLQNNNDFKALNNLPDAQLNIQAIKLNETESTIEYSVSVENKGAHLAFMTAMRLTGEKSGTEILPSYWNNNYFTLLPGKEIKTSVIINKADMFENPVVTVKAYNQDEAAIIPIAIK